MIIKLLSACTRYSQFWFIFGSVFVHGSVVCINFFLSFPGPVRKATVQCRYSISDDKTKFNSSIYGEGVGNVQGLTQSTKAESNSD